MIEAPEEPWFKWLEMQTRPRQDMGVYVRASDVAECIALALEDTRSGTEIYNLSARDVVFAGSIREALEKYFPDYPKLPESWGKSDSPYAWQKAKAHFGWEPKWNLFDFAREKLGRELRVQV
jgi:nucleoside-diphosphate-sugar epimerase